MNLNEKKYTQFFLCREMMETSEIVSNFNPEHSMVFATAVKHKKALFLTGEGSSRIFPARKAIYNSMIAGLSPAIMTEGATQALEYPLSDFAVFGASNSGETREVIRLFKKLKDEGHSSIYSITANFGTPLERLAQNSHVLSCGKENAVAATKSVIEQALFYDSLLHALNGKRMSGLKNLGDLMKTVLTMDIDKVIIDKIKNAATIYFSGRHNGVAEELTLKTNEITRKRSDYLEGTYAVHGIEEVMRPDDVLVIIDPFESEEAKIRNCISDGVGASVVAVSSRQTCFPTIILPDAGYFQNYIEMAAGWNLLVETGLALGIDLDKPVRARKIGNAFTE